MKILVFILSVNLSFTPGVDFPKNFATVTRTVMKRLFRVYAHIYYQHFDDIERLKEEAHLNTSFKHFVLFVQEFGLVDAKELQPLQELIDKLTKTAVVVAAKERGF